MPRTHAQKKADLLDEKNQAFQNAGIEGTGVGIKVCRAPCVSMGRTNHRMGSNCVFCERMHEYVFVNSSLCERQG